MRSGHSKLFSLLLLVLFILSLWGPGGTLSAQDFPYRLEMDREVALIAFGGVASGLGHLLEKDLGEVGIKELSTQGTANVSFFDRGATRQQSEGYRNLSDQLLRTSFLVPITLGLSKSARSKPLIVGTMLFQTALLNEGITKAIKVTVKRKRPFTYNPDFPGYEEGFRDDARQSFVSGHTSNTAALSFFTAKLFHDLYPESKLRPYVWTAAALLPAATGYARYRAGKHFPTDIIAGYALGATIGILVPQIHKARPNGRGASFGTTSEGIGLTVKW